MAMRSSRDAKIHGRLPDFARHPVRPDPVERDPLDERVYVGLKAVLPEEDLLRKQVVDAQIRHVVTELGQRGSRAFGVVAFRIDEEVHIEGRAGIPVHWESRRADHDVADATCV